MFRKLYRSHLDAEPAEVYAWHARPGAFQRLAPPWIPLRLESRQDIADGNRVVIRLGSPPVGWRWVAEFHDCIEGRQFADRQVTGPFKSWDHYHRFNPADGGTELADEIHYAPAMGPLGRRFDRFIGSTELDHQFAYRHRVTAGDLALHRHYNPDGRRLRVAVSGASGLVGSALSAFLESGGHEVRRLVRDGAAGDGEILWNPETGDIEADKLEGLDAVVHLAGENIFGLWTADKRRRIRESRVLGTGLIARTLAGLDKPPGVFVSASAVGYYGSRGPERLTEDSPVVGEGFLAELCRDWEAAADPAREAGIRTVHPRIGIVISTAGGALAQMAPAFRLGLGGRFGAREQYFPWILIDDMLGAIYHLIFTDSLSGPVNFSAPEPATVEEFTATLAAVLERPALLHMPVGLVRRVSGEFGRELLLSSTRAVPARLTGNGYDFLYPDLATGLAHQLGRSLAPLEEV